ncbi:hypothetical protein SKL01_13400 [Staphylococcus kloosii]|uniref:Uncharacterized protein n=1 Tax=Staphylococcus kloosii TaxID=29384 RepID=A0ABQ0XL49_9STAP|nr:hypothetical protein SKL01_13400 [Staphylococcus kloosii]
MFIKIPTINIKVLSNIHITATYITLFFLPLGILLESIEAIIFKFLVDSKYKQINKIIVIIIILTIKLSTILKSISYYNIIFS